MTNLKIHAEHFATLEDAVSPFYNKLTASQYKDAGLSFARFLHDALYAGKLSAWVCDTLYPYLDDTHIKSALKAIARKNGIETW